MTAPTWPLADIDLACLDCNRVIPIGTPYSRRLVAWDPIIEEIVEAVCVYCAHSPATYAPVLVD